MERIILGWSPAWSEDSFVVSPRRFSALHRLSPCQSGIVIYLSRYYFEKNPWLLDQSILLIELILEYGYSYNALQRLFRVLFGLKLYLAPTAHSLSLEKMTVSAYCMVNGIGPELLLPIKLVCDNPTKEGLLQALELIRKIR